MSVQYVGDKHLFTTTDGGGGGGGLHKIKHLQQKLIVCLKGCTSYI